MIDKIVRANTDNSAELRRDVIHLLTVDNKTKRKSERDAYVRGLRGVSVSSSDWQRNGDYQRRDDYTFDTRHTQPASVITRVILAHIAATAANIPTT